MANCENCGGRLIEQRDGFYCKSCGGRHILMLVMTNDKPSLENTGGFNLWYFPIGFVLILILTALISQMG